MAKTPRPRRDRKGDRPVASTASLLARVTPGARQDRLSFDADGVLRVAVRARAVDGQANRALCGVLAARLGLPPSAVTVMHGATSRQKVVQVLGLSSAALAQRLAALRSTPRAPSAPSRGAPEEG